MVDLSELCEHLYAYIYSMIYIYIGYESVMLTTTRKLSERGSQAKQAHCEPTRQIERVDVMATGVDVNLSWHVIPEMGHMMGKSVQN